MYIKNERGIKQIQNYFFYLIADVEDIANSNDNVSLSLCVCMYLHIYKVSNIKNVK